MLEKGFTIYLCWWICGIVPKEKAAISACYQIFFRSNIRSSITTTKYCLSGFIVFWLQRCYHLNREASKDLGKTKGQKHILMTFLSELRTTDPWRWFVLRLWTEWISNNSVFLTPSRLSQIFRGQLMQSLLTQQAPSTFQRSNTRSVLLKLLVILLSWFFS